MGNAVTVLRANASTRPAEIMSPNPPSALRGLRGQRKAIATPMNSASARAPKPIQSFVKKLRREDWGEAGLILSFFFIPILKYGSHEEVSVSYHGHISFIPSPRNRAQVTVITTNATTSMTNTACTDSFLIAVNLFRTNT